MSRRYLFLAFLLGLALFAWTGAINSCVQVQHDFDRIDQRLAHLREGVTR
jgi:hypothetical protein